MLDTIDVSCDSKRHSNFDLKRAANCPTRLQEACHRAPLRRINRRDSDHDRKAQYGRFGDNHLTRTSGMIKAERDGQF